MFFCQGIHTFSGQYHRGVNSPESEGVNSPESNGVNSLEFLRKASPIRGGQFTGIMGGQFNGVYTGIFDRNLGYVNEGNIAAYFTYEPNHIYNLNVLEGDPITVDAYWLTWTASSACGELRAVRCAK